jgi:hypothetical protein
MITTIKPKVSVLMTFSNGFEMSKYALESVLWQTLVNFEVWIIGDERNQGIKNLSYAFAHDPRIHICHVPQNLNSHGFEGLRRARAEYIAYINPGQLWLPEHLQELVDHLDNTRADIALSMMQAVYSESRSGLMVPELPELPVTPEATVVMHRRNVMDRLGMAEDGPEHVRYSRSFLCTAQRKGMLVEVVPAMTAVKFPGLNILAGTLPQQRYIDKVKRDPAYVKRELSAILLRYDVQFRRLPSPYRLFCIVTRSMRSWVARFGVEERWQAMIAVVFKRKPVETEEPDFTDSFIPAETNLREHR